MEVTQDPWQDLGDDHTAQRRYIDGKLEGVAYHHKDQDGRLCQGWAPVGRDLFGETWDLISIEPLTISPSLLCRRCGDHGFITDGKWVRA